MKYLLRRDSNINLKESKTIIINSETINRNVEKELVPFLKSLGYIVETDVSKSCDIFLSGQILNNKVDYTYKYLIEENTNKLNTNIKKKILEIDRKINIQKGFI